VLIDITKAWGKTPGNDTLRDDLRRLWALIKWTIFSNDDGE
jgi:hypothetical protein